MRYIVILCAKRSTGGRVSLGVVQSLSLYIGKIVTCDVCTIFLIDAEAQQLWTVEPTAADSRQSFALDEVTSVCAAQ
jgi:hypothetical protein